MAAAGAACRAPLLAKRVRHPVPQSRRRGVPCAARPVRRRDVRRGLRAGVNGAGRDLAAILDPGRAVDRRLRFVSCLAGNRLALATGGHRTLEPVCASAPMSRGRRPDNGAENLDELLRRKHGRIPGTMGVPVVACHRFLRLRLDPAALLRDDPLGRHHRAGVRARVPRAAGTDGGAVHACRAADHARRAGRRDPALRAALGRARKRSDYGVPAPASRAT